MSQPKAKCVFCGQHGKLTKSHVWPKWLDSILPQSASHHEQIIGRFDTFVPTAAGPSYWRKVRQGHVGTRKPRNTCSKCNGEWMRQIEEAAMPIMRPLLRGNPYLLLEPPALELVASLLCLVSMRVEFLSREMRAIPAADHDWLRTKFTPPADWKIWIARYEGDLLTDERYTAMQITSSRDVPVGVEHCNTQVTTLVVGHLCAHLFSSTVWRDFDGYEGIDLPAIWPPRKTAILARSLPVITQAEVPWPHETVARETPNRPDFSFTARFLL